MVTSVKLSAGGALAVKVHKAERARNLPPVLSAVISIEAEPLPGHGAINHEREARELASALWETLPGGTMDALIAELFRKRANFLSRVAHQQQEQEMS